MAVNRERVALLVEALESGQYEQGRWSLSKDGKFCCLGVACEVARANGLSITIGSETFGDGQAVTYDGAARRRVAGIAISLSSTGMMIQSATLPGLLSAITR
jgi:hypothetical protein